MADQGRFSRPAASSQVALAPDGRSRQLLASVLWPSELEQWRAHSTFWVHTRIGWFRFGTLYDIRFRASRWPAVERSICVVTEGFARRPLPDLWAELVVTARANPQALAGAANFRDEASARAPGSNDPLILRRWLECQRDTFRHLLARRFELDAAYLAYDTAFRARRSTRPSWGNPFARKAAQMIHELSARHPDERDRLESAHAPILELAESVGGQGASLAI